MDQMVANFMGQTVNISSKKIYCKKADENYDFLHTCNILSRKHRKLTFSLTVIRIRVHMVYISNFNR